VRREAGDRERLRGDHTQLEGGDKVEMVLPMTAQRVYPTTGSPPAAAAAK